MFTKNKSKILGSILCAVLVSVSFFYLKGNAQAFDFSFELDEISLWMTMVHRLGE